MTTTLEDFAAEVAGATDAYGAALVEADGEHIRVVTDLGTSHSYEIEPTPEAVEEVAAAIEAKGLEVFTDPHEWDAEFGEVDIFEDDDFDDSDEFWEVDDDFDWAADEDD